MSRGGKGHNQPHATLQLASRHPTTDLTPPHNWPHATPQLASPPTPLQGERGVICLACVVQKHGLGESTRCFVMALQTFCMDTTRCLYRYYKMFVPILQDVCTDTTRCLYRYYKMFVPILQDVCTDTTRCLYGHYKALSSASTRCLVLMYCCA